MLFPGPDPMFSQVTGVNCPSCSLPFDRWVQCLINDIFRLFYILQNMVQVSEAVFDWLVRPWEMFQLHFPLKDPDLSSVPPEFDRLYIQWIYYTTD